MVTERLQSKPPSEYEVGEVGLVRHIGRGKGVKREGTKITSPKAVEAEILQIDTSLRRYKVRKGNKVKWHSVADITSLTKEVEKNREKASLKGNKLSSDRQTQPSTSGLHLNICDKFKSIRSKYILLYSCLHRVEILH